MSSRAMILTPVRFISRSCSRPKAQGSSEAKKLNLKDKIDIPVETDTQKLATHVCGTNLFHEGGQDVKIKPDSEYPEWLWSIRAPPPLEELDKNSKTYWNRIRGQREREIRYLNSLQRNKSVHK